MRIKSQEGHLVIVENQLNAWNVLRILLTERHVSRNPVEIKKQFTDQLPLLCRRGMQNQGMERWVRDNITPLISNRPMSEKQIPQVIVHPTNGHGDMCRFCREYQGCLRQPNRSLSNISNI